MLAHIDDTTVMVQERPPDRIRWPQYGPVLRGWLACEFERPISENPHDDYSEAWKEWREGWFARNRGEDAVVPCESWDEIPQS